MHRHDEQSPTRSCVLVGLLHGHIRIGSFQRFAYLGQTDNIETLLRHTVRYYYPDLDPDAAYDQVVLSFLSAFAERVSDMVAGWMAAGFVHGVLNTDNFNITGESFDYGPWRFLPHLDPGFTAAYFDETGRYAYGRQPLHQCGLCAGWQIVLCLPWIPRHWQIAYQASIRLWNVILLADYAGASA